MWTQINLHNITSIVKCLLFTVLSLKEHFIQPGWLRLYSFEDWSESSLKVPYILWHLFLNVFPVKKVCSQWLDKEQSWIHHDNICFAKFRLWSTGTSCTKPLFRNTQTVNTQTNLYIWAGWSGYLQFTIWTTQKPKTAFVTSACTNYRATRKKTSSWCNPRFEQPKYHIYLAIRQGFPSLERLTIN